VRSAGLRCEKVWFVGIVRLRGEVGYFGITTTEYLVTTGYEMILYLIGYDLR